jgi:hypothetical protein
MPYVACPSYCDDAQAREANPIQCLLPAKRFLDETSHASETERIEKLVASAVGAGWEEDEVRKPLSATQAPTDTQEFATISLVPTSAKTP